MRVLLMQRRCCALVTACGSVYEPHDMVQAWHLLGMPEHVGGKKRSMDKCFADDCEACPSAL